MSRDSLNIDVYHKGVFSPNPFVYFYPHKVPVMGLDVCNMDFMEFKTYLQKLINNRCRDMYYCLKNQSLVDGLRELRDEDDYVRFLDVGFDDDDNQISIYIDDYHEPLLDWIEEEKLKNGTVVLKHMKMMWTRYCRMIYRWTMKLMMRTFNGLKLLILFLSQKNLIPERGIEEEASDKVKKHPIHDPNQKWDTMMPELGMKFSDRDDLKHMLTNYAVSKGYSLWYEKNEATTLLVRCSKNEKGKPSCPFRLWGSPMNKENSFQINSLIDKHNCARQQILGCLVTYKWIGKMLIADILERPKFSYRKMEEVVRKDYGLKC
ncbi:unnamed protein product [Lactuca saligna]|uniref:Transposase MuDR plant domain-containing protein n=1 Tax=Lactuca saligna TaxID=75948 RepID=A0AA35YPR5_LACSI|nr:unnamed protein product [Lactuca saligna]